MEKYDIYFWGNIEVRIIKLYLELNKVKICEICNERTHIVDMCALQKNKEGTINISIKWLDFKLEISRIVRNDLGVKLDLTVLRNKKIDWSGCDRSVGENIGIDEWIVQLQGEHEALKTIRPMLSCIRIIVAVIRFRLVCMRIKYTFGTMEKCRRNWILRTSYS